jgi:predicted RNase H-like HicB family nuclease
MSDVFHLFQNNVHTFHSQLRKHRASASRLMEEDARLLSRSRTAVDSSRELLRQTDDLVHGPQNTGEPMSGYIAVAIPLPTGEWREYFPDLMGCAREANDPDAALDSATRAAKAWIAHSQNQTVPLPRTLDEIRSDAGWADQRLVNWQKAIVRIVHL